ncbi:MAG TPA: FHA domain-containing protein [Kofleriaceae bacterium]|jgi:pSer/pThr/pTyr-binding forkhead associated (FHA) protein
MFKLVIQDDEGKTTVVPLIRDEITIGRKEGNTIRLTERNVSRRHARILRSDNDVQIEDLGSYNGIRVNNARIAERVSLRISDQVQIGDYKLYLKAEGVEQVDDARTMPIERIDTPPAEMPAVVPPPTGQPTTPMAAQARPAVAPLAVADTDPAGRPVATAAQVAALTAPAGYGKFVVTSSNFAGKELDLTRPQMVIGRTDDNDLVLNHRSISRNHAKVTRDPETQRYTISDLQSSNGVRVNGQDYSKVELRRGDVVDLGHVRLRFVEPGEDFVFSRDAVIQDMPEGGRSRAMLGAIVLAVLVLGAVVAYFALKPSNGGETPTNPDHNNTVNNGSNETTNNGSGSGLAVAMAEIDAGTSGFTTGSNDSPEVARLEGECLSDADDRKWGNVKTCADQLDGIKPGKGKQYRDRADLEIGAQANLDHMQNALKDRDLKSAQKFKDKIPAASVYAPDAETQLNKEKASLVAEGLKRAQVLARQHKCDDYDRYIQQEGSSLGEDVGQAIAAQAPKCETQAVAPPVDCSTSLMNNTARCKQEFCAGHGASPQCAAAVVAPPPCDEAALIQSGTGATGTGDYAGALKSYEKAFQCRPEQHTLELAFMAACNSRNQPRAQYWWKKLSSEAQSRYVIMCIRQGITRPQLDGSP